MSQVRTIVTEDVIEDVTQDLFAVANVKGRTLGLGSNVDIDLSKNLTGKERQIAKEAFSSGKDHDPVYPMWITPLNCANMILCVYIAGSAIKSGEITPFGFLINLVFTYFFIEGASGCLHLVLDNPNFLVGPIAEFARGFQEHHFDTTLICKMTVWNHIRVVQMPMIIVSAICYPFVYHCPHFFLWTFFAQMMLFYMQMCHRWAHMPPARRGPVVTFLQKNNIALPPSEHLKHHHAPFDHNFCIMNGMFNPVLNQIITMGPYLHPHSKLWAPIFVVYCLIPAMLISCLY